MKGKEDEAKLDQKHLQLEKIVAETFLLNELKFYALIDAPVSRYIFEQ